MKHPVVMCAALALAVMSCSCRSALLAQSKDVALAQSFTLRPGGAVPIGGEQLRVGFDAVLGDSRCPKGEQCIREGDATVRVWLQKGTGAREPHELRTTEAERSASSAAGYTVRLIQLDPYPVSGRSIGRADYVATLVVSKGAAPPDAPR